MRSATETPTPGCTAPLDDYLLHGPHTAIDVMSKITGSPKVDDLLRSNDLIWNYLASSWLMGEKPPAFDILAWNADSTTPGGVPPR